MSAFEDLYTQHNNRVLRLLTSKLPTREDAEDVAQDVWLAVYQSLTADIRNPRQWLDHLAMTAIADFYQKRAQPKRGGGQTRIPLGEGLPDRVSIEQEVADRLRLQAVGAVLSGINPAHRDIFLRYVMEPSGHCRDGHARTQLERTVAVRVRQKVASLCPA